MKYTKKERAEIAKAFRAASAWLEADEAKFICYAIAYTGLRGAVHAEKTISERLGDCDYLSQWLHWNVPESRKHLNSYEIMKSYRLRWLDALIEEFSA